MKRSMWGKSNLHLTHRLVTALSFICLGSTAAAQETVPPGERTGEQVTRVEETPGTQTQEPPENAPPQEESAPIAEEQGGDDLADLSLEELMNVDVTVASKRSESMFDAPGVVSVITREEIEMFGDRTLLQVLGRLPGVFTTSSHLFPSNTVSIRGDLQSNFNNRVLILINGRPVRESIGGGINFPIYASYPVEMIERVEMVRGPGSVLYGTNAYVGVINVITKRGEETSLTFKTGGGSFGYYEASLSGGFKKGDLSFYGTVKGVNEDGWAFSAIDEAGVSDSIKKGQHSISLASRIEYGQLTLDLFYSDSEMDNIARAALWGLPGHDVDSKRLFLDLGWHQPLADRWDLDLHFGVNYFEWIFEEGLQVRRNADYLGEITLSGQPLDGLNVVAGFVIEEQTAPSIERSSLRKYSRNPVSAYAQLDYRLTDRLKLTGGFQWNKPEDGSSDVVPRFGAVLDLNDNWGVKLLYGEAFRAPWEAERSVNNPVILGNPKLEPETIETLDAQLFYHDETSQFALTYFDSKMDDLINRAPGVGRQFTFANVGEVDVWGLELEGKHYFSPELYVLGSVTYQEQKEKGNPTPSLAPSTTAKIGLGYANGDGFTLSIFNTFVSSPQRAPGAARLNPNPDDFNLLNVHMTMDVTDLMKVKRGKATFFLRGENLLDEDIHHVEFNRRLINSLPGGPGAAVYAGIAIKF